MINWYVITGFSISYSSLIVISVYLSVTIKYLHSRNKDLKTYITKLENGERASHGSRIGEPEEVLPGKHRARPADEAGSGEPADGGDAAVND